MTLRLLPLYDREPRPDAGVLNPEMAQYHLWLAQAQFDHRNFGVRELAGMEQRLAPLAQRARILFNPFTGEYRMGKIDLG